LNGLSAGTIYAQRPPGDSPELMPLDTVLFMDVHYRVNRHVMITDSLYEDDPNKFSLSTPKRVSDAYLRILSPTSGGSPCSDRILQDCLNWREHLEIIREAGGAMVEGVGNRREHRRRNVPRSKGGWGGKRKKKEPKPLRWLHPDAEGCVAAIMVQHASITVQQQKGGRRKLTIVDPPENDDLLPGQVDYCVIAGDEDDGLWDEDDEDEAEFVDHAHDESMVFGLMGMVDITLFDKEL
jgi:hypothetical protein